MVIVVILFSIGSIAGAKRITCTSSSGIKYTYVEQASNITFPGMVTAIETWYNQALAIGMNKKIYGQPDIKSGRVGVFDPNSKKSVQSRPGIDQYTILASFETQGSPHPIKMTCVAQQ